MKVRQECASIWTIWELSTSRLYVDPSYMERAEKIADAFARIESHYFVNGGFFEYDGQIIAEVASNRPPSSSL